MNENQVCSLCDLTDLPVIVKRFSTLQFVWDVLLYIDVTWCVLFCKVSASDISERIYKKDSINYNRIYRNENNETKLRKIDKTKNRG